ncbi:MAG: hypothetical protein H6918_04805 [Sphingomonadaceae bacterium]|nr:hypothetical protein [Sphingomonadaceae bacterium]
MSHPLALSPASSVSLTHIGAEHLPLLVVEDALADPALVVSIAARHDFGRHGPFYPGLRAPVSETVAMPLVAPLLDAMQQAFALDRPLRYYECYLSIVTTPASELTPIQRLPHFDGVERERIAVLLYLDQQERAGTAFYRQRGTGFESVDAERFEPYRSELERGTDAHGIPDAAYIHGDTALFEQVHIVEGRFNRMVAYHGNSLHCAALKPDFEPVADAADGRLTLNLFLTA